MMQKVLLNATLCYLLRDPHVLLARKRKKIGAGLWNGYGGGIEAGENPRMAAARELREESGGVIVVPEDLYHAAVIDFHNSLEDNSSFTCRVHVFLARSWKGAPEQTSEMSAPAWFPISTLPFQEMMLADVQWLPRVLSGGRWYGKAWYGPHQATLLKDVYMETSSSELLDRL